MRETAPADDEWLHEIKLDGYRMLAHLDGARVRLVSRNDLDWTHRLGSIVRALARLDLSDTLARCFVAGEDLGTLLVYSGWAVAFVRSQLGVGGC